MYCNSKSVLSIKQIANPIPSFPPTGSILIGDEAAPRNTRSRDDIIVSCNSCRLRNRNREHGSLQRTAPMGTSNQHIVLVTLTIIIPTSSAASSVYPVGSASRGNRGITLRMRRWWFNKPFIVPWFPLNNSIKRINPIGEGTSVAGWFNESLKEVEERNAEDPGNNLFRRVSWSGASLRNQILSIVLERYRGV